MKNILKFKIYGLHAHSSKLPSNVAHKRVKMLFNNSINVFRFVRGDVDRRIIAHLNQMCFREWKIFFLLNPSEDGKNRKNVQGYCKESQNKKKNWIEILII